MARGRTYMYVIPLRSRFLEAWTHRHHHLAVPGYKVFYYVNSPAIVNRHTKRLEPLYLLEFMRPFYGYLGIYLNDLP